MEYFRLTYDNKKLYLIFMLMKKKKKAKESQEPM